MEKTRTSNNEPVFIKILQPEDVSEDYVIWYSNKQVINYSDNQYRSFSLEGQKIMWKVVLRITM